MGSTDSKDNLPSVSGSENGEPLPSAVEVVVEKYLGEYQKKYLRFAKTVDELLRLIINKNNIDIHLTTYREKSPKSLGEKITRDGKSYNNPLEDVTDLAGVRIITYYVSDVDRILPLIYSEFIVDRDKSVDKRKSKDPSVFGYSSVHLIVELSESRTLLPEYEEFRGLKCEIQVRTILQHTWAEIEHSLVYKAKEDIPPELRRKFAILSGMLESADSEFESLKEAELEVRKQIIAKINKKNINIPVNIDSLEVYLEKYHNCKNLRVEAIRDFNKFLWDHDVKTIIALNSILTKDALGKSDELIRRYPKCDLHPGSDCLLRYFVAVGNNFNDTLQDIGEKAHCNLLASCNHEKIGKIQIQTLCERLQEHQTPME
jgi:ppGpp synthetase/RelA/SpoT-type nucleotidyltranferase